MHGALFAPSLKPAKDNSSGERKDGEGGALFCKEIFLRRRAKCGCFSYREPLRLNLAHLSDLATSSCRRVADLCRRPRLENRVWR